MLLRTGLGVALIAQGGLCLTGPGRLSETIFAIAALTGGGLLTIGFLMPAASALLALGCLVLALDPAHACARNLFDGRLSIVFAVILWTAITMLGPGAFSLDARLFGHREIIIPPLPGGRDDGSDE